MKVLIVGGGGREHALAWAVAKSAGVERVYVAPGNAGTATEPKCENVPISAGDLGGLIGFARERGVGLTIAGPEGPLVNGIVDRFRAAGLKCFGPTAAAARLEGSKGFAKDFMARHGIPTAAYGTFTEVAPAIEFIRAHGAPIVVKADGLAAGKGVIVAQTTTQAGATFCRWRPRRTTRPPATATAGRTPAAWAPIPPPRSLTRPCTDASWTR